MEPPPPGPPPPAVKFQLKKPLKFAKVVKPKVEQVAAPTMTPEEQEKAFVEKYSKVRGGIFKMGPEATFSQVLEMISKHPDTTCVAFDYDQTLHLREHYRGRSLELLKRLQALGVPFCIVTAAQPRVTTVKALSEELMELHLDSFFKTTALDPTRALDIIAEKWGDNAKLSDQELQRKLMLLFALKTDRRPNDLVRIGYSNAKISDDGQTATYRLKRGAADWSAELSENLDKENPKVCLVSCLSVYLDRILPTRPRPVYREIDLEKDMPDDIAPDDALFMAADNQVYDVAGFEAVVQEFLLKEGEYPSWQVDGLMRETAQELNVKGIQMARFGSLISAKYNKAEAIEYFLEDFPNCEQVIFVDDNFDNVFNVFLRFTELETKAKDGKAATVSSVWYEPAADGNPEKYDAGRVKLGGLIMRSFDEIDLKTSVHAVASLGAFGEVKFDQADNLSPLKVSVDPTSKLAVNAVLKISNSATGEPFNPAKKPLDLAERPGCDGIRLKGAAEAESFAFTLFGNVSVLGKHVVLIEGGKVLASGVIERK